MIKKSSPNYFHDTSIKRATEAWKEESEVEKLISNEYNNLTEVLEKELSTLYAKYGVEGSLDYATLKQRLTPAELTDFRSRVKVILANHRDELDEQSQLNIENLTKYKNMSRIDSSTAIVEAHHVVLLNKIIEILSESSSDTYKFVFLHTLYDVHRKAGFKTSNTHIDKVKMNETVWSDWSGDTFADALRHSQIRLSRDIKKNIVKSIRRNEDYQRLIKNLTDLVGGGKGYKHTLSILRGETARIIAESTAQSYEQAGLEQYKFVATLDDRTTTICRDMDGRIFNLKDMEVGVNCNPMHFNCRSTISGHFPDDDLSKLERMARNPDTGENYKVPASMTYHEWNEKYN